MVGNTETSSFRIFYLPSSRSYSHKTLLFRICFVGWFVNRKSLLFYRNLAHFPVLRCFLRTEITGCRPFFLPARLNYNPHNTKAYGVQLLGPIFTLSSAFLDFEILNLLFDIRNSIRLLYLRDFRTLSRPKYAPRDLSAEASPKAGEPRRKKPIN